MVCWETLKDWLIVRYNFLPTDGLSVMIEFYGLPTRVRR